MLSKEKKKELHDILEFLCNRAEGNSNETIVIGITHGYGCIKDKEVVQKEVEFTKNHITSNVLKKGILKIENENDKKVIQKKE